MKFSAGTLRQGLSPLAFSAISGLMAQNARYAVGEPTLIVDHSGGNAAGPISGISTPFAYSSPGGKVLAPFAGFNTAIQSADNAISSLGKYLSDNGLVKLGLNPLTLNATGVVGTPGTVPVVVQAGATDGGAYATDSYTVPTGNQAANDTVTIGGHVVTFVAAAPAANQVLIGANAAGSAANFATYVNANPGTFGVSAVATGAVVGLTALASGVGGNSITLAKSSVAAGAAIASPNFAGGATNGALSRLDAAAAISALRNNLSSVIRAYNILATALGVATIMDNTAGKASITDPIVLSNVMPSSVPVGASSSVAAAADINVALVTLSNNVAYIIAQTNTLLFASDLTYTSPILVP